MSIYGTKIRNQQVVGSSPVFSLFFYIIKMIPLVGYFFIPKIRQDGYKGKKWAKLWLNKVILRKKI